MNRFLLALAFAGASTSITLAAAKPVLAAPAAGNVAAEVNGDKIPLDDLNRIVATVKAGDPTLDGTTPEIKKRMDDIQRGMLDQLIATKLLVQEARRRKINIAPKAADDALAQLKTNFKSDADFQTWLKSDGKTVDDVRGAIVDELSIRELSTQLTRDILVTPDDIATYYRAHQDQFAIPETVTARHIMLAINPAASPADKEVVNKRAQNLLKQLRGKNADFAALAKTNSDDATTKDDGGQMGTFARGDMIPAIEDACFGAKVGDVVGPITTEFGLHLIRIDAKTSASTAALKDVQDDPRLKALLLKQKVQARLDEQIAKLRTSATIKRNV